MSSLVKCVVSDYSGKKYGRSRGVLEIWNEIMSNQLEGLVQFPIWSFFFVRRYCWNYWYDFFFVWVLFG